MEKVVIKESDKGLNIIHKRDNIMVSKEFEQKQKQKEKEEEE
jgi:hypothetical protein